MMKTKITGIGTDGHMIDSMRYAMESMKDYVPRKTILSLKLIHISYYKKREPFSPFFYFYKTRHIFGGLILEIRIGEHNFSITTK